MVINYENLYFDTKYENSIFETNTYHNSEDDRDQIIQIICWREGYGIVKVEDEDTEFDIEVVIKNKN